MRASLTDVIAVVSVIVLVICAVLLWNEYRAERQFQGCVASGDSVTMAILKSHPLSEVRNDFIDSVRAGKANVASSSLAAELEIWTGAADGRVVPWLTDNNDTIPMLSLSLLHLCDPSVPVERKYITVWHEFQHVKDVWRKGWSWTFTRSPESAVAGFRSEFRSYRASCELAEELEYDWWLCEGYEYATKEFRLLIADITVDGETYVPYRQGVLRAALETPLEDFYIKDH